uniref:DUF547 domain-containing protein n=1 Tax=Branchiostoma floridae TaxID=7739 RepID=C3Z4Y0_BRAFL|eukprot:XP_002596325.1 hypothetical protein BRAFLDRAFT_76126 [Branchiostoma floridae]
MAAEIRVLNEARPAGDVSRDLQRLMNRMKGEHMVAGGRGVDYEALRDSQLFKDYLWRTLELRNSDIYNALNIHGLVQCKQLPSSVLDVRQFWKTTAYNIGGLVFSLDDIEHGILRGNRPHPSSTECPFQKDDPRLRFSLETLDPRIHFSLVCGAKSCPAISVYNGENVDRALTAAAKGFCEQEVLVDMKRKEISLSKIFQWYRSDFGKDDIEAVRWTIPYLSEDKQYGVESLLSTMEQEGGVSILYSEYNWHLNDTEIILTPQQARYKMLGVPLEDVETL